MRNIALLFLTCPNGPLRHALARWPSYRTISLIHFAIRIRLWCVLFVAIVILIWVMALAPEAKSDNKTTLAYYLAGILAALSSEAISRIFNIGKSKITWQGCDMCARDIVESILSAGGGIGHAYLNLQQQRVRGVKGAWKTTMEWMNADLYPPINTNPPAWARSIDALQCVIPFLVAPVLLVCVAIGLLFVEGGLGVRQYVVWLSGSTPAVFYCSWVIGAAVVAMYFAVEAAARTIRPRRLRGRIPS